MKVSLARTSLVNEPGKCGKTIAVVYELTKRTQEKLFADWAQQYKAFFVPNQVQVSASIFGNSSVRVGTQGLFRLYLKTFVPPFLPTRLTALGSPRMAKYGSCCSGLWATDQFYCSFLLRHNLLRLLPHIQIPFP